MANYPNFYAQQQQASNNIIWVQGENSARSWMMAPNSNILLMDSDSARFYIKNTDNMGMPTMRTFEYKEITSNFAPNSTPEEKQIDFIGREEFEALKGKIEELEEKMTTPKRGKENAKSNVSNDE